MRTLGTVRLAIISYKPMLLLVVVVVMMVVVVIVVVFVVVVVVVNVITINVDVFAHLLVVIIIPNIF